MRELHLVVGPNGAGKSTFVELVLQPAMPRLPFVNADVIAKTRWPSDAEARSYDAARIADGTREALIGAGDSFITETVFSHPSKLELIRSARAHGFVVHLHVVMVPEDVSVARVQRRVRAGGHSVPEEKIRDRHRRLWPLVAEAVPVVSSAVVYDNSHRSGPVEVALFVSGQAAGAANWPAWAPSELTALWAASGPPP